MPRTPRSSTPRHFRKVRWAQCGAALATTRTARRPTLPRSKQRCTPMRNIIGGVFLSLDGVMQGPGGPTEDVTGGFDEGGWVFKVWDKAVGDAIGTLFAGEYDLLLGRRTYD